MKKFFIIPACTDLNRGDQVLVWEAVNLIKDAYPESESYIVDYGMTPEDRERQCSQTKEFGFNVVSNIVEHPKRNTHAKTKVHDDFKTKLIAGITAIFDFIKLLLILFLPKEAMFNFWFSDNGMRQSFKLFLDTDAVVVKGGGFVHTYGKIEDLYYLWFNFYYLILAKRLSKKIIILPNSFGPIKGVLNKIFIKKIIDISDLVYSREDISKNVLTNIGCKNINVAYDLGYYIRPSNTFSSKEKENTFNEIDETKNNIAITVRPYRFPNSLEPLIAYQNYINAIASFCEKHPNYTFYFVVQVDGPSAHESDIIAINDVISKLSENVKYKVINLDFNCLEITKLYSKFKFVIGTRFHSIIFSQTVNIPGIAIAYGGNKTQGIMDKIGLGHYVVKIEDINVDKLDALFLDLVKGKDKYIDILFELRKKIDDDRNNMINKIKETIK